MELEAATTTPSIPWYVPRLSSETTSEVTIITNVRIPPPPTPARAPAIVQRISDLTHTSEDTCEALDQIHGLEPTKDDEHDHALRDSAQDRPDQENAQATQ